MADESANKSKDRKGFIFGLAPFGIVFISKADMVPIKKGDSVLGQNGSLRIPAHISDRVTGVYQRGTDVGIPDILVDSIQQAIETGVVLKILRG
jgi:hypothetical protein